jgi:hypothetical protein
MARRKRRLSWIGGVVAVLAIAGPGHAQNVGGGVVTSASGYSRIGTPLPGPVGGTRTTVAESNYAGTSGLSPYYAAPGNYGTAYGYASYGYPRTYTSFSSPYGGGMGYGVAPYGYISNRYGVGLWRPGYTVPGYAYRSSYYWTYAPAPIRPPVSAPFPPFGSYAPGFGPSALYGW